jgi:sporulation protein YlmC with PRC-barrel domain
MSVWAHIHMRLTLPVTPYKVAQILGIARREIKIMKSKDFMDKDVFALEEKIGRVKDIEMDPEDWKINHLEIELEKNIAESVLGAKKSGVRNMLAISALEKGTARWTVDGLQLKVSKDQLHMYLRPVIEA